MRDRACNICGKITKEDNYIPLRGDSCVCRRCGAMIQRVMCSMDYDYDEQTGNLHFNDNEPFGSVKTPRKIKEYLDCYVIGQDEAKKVLSVAAYNHYKRINRSDMAESMVKIEKSNVLLMGPTGCGKTFLVSTVAKVLGVPFAHCDATSLTEAGFIGEDVESILTRLLMNAKMDVSSAERGIVFIDEIDKLVSNGAGNDSPSHKGVQQALLKLIEGADGVAVPTSIDTNKTDKGSTHTVLMSTKNILFICGGAFSGIEDIINKRVGGKRSIGIGANIESDEKRKNIVKEVCTEDVVKYGLMPEFLGRLPVISVLEEMTEEMLVEILMKPKNCLYEQYRELLRADEVDLVIEPDAACEIAKKALEYKSGARSLRSVMENLLLPIMYEIPDRKDVGVVRITSDYVKGVSGQAAYDLRTNKEYRYA